jgi:hypothetical protein
MLNVNLKNPQKQIQNEAKKTNKPIDFLTNFDYNNINIKQYAGRLFCKQ